ncbi:Uncharacterised protein [Klebsiella oxytoca]|uniref:hypothetical protein n=1 Tax=Enterobacteriaceae TaxID=543 RepID=UPI00024FBF7C|nr:MULTISPECIES: hypothetical protein [Enterobacteriaceae]MDU5168765.1 hypothetical protein [Haemophilus parainfluenzae]DAZ13430.1 MAG TPA: hypothetical protein [Caudoviricetes sp.]HCB2884090.1 hypothetical protein [Citrobacter freundii]HDT3641795.1 hypothetical protein [Klebsiella pneumoniae subsp. pneumoniae]EFG1536047.1 hypothetical protein [Escherichia coli]
MNEYLNQVDEIAIALYESELLPDFKPDPPKESKQELDAMGCIFDSNVWDKQISVKEVMYKMMSDERMETVWPALKKRAEECSVPSLFYIALSTEISTIYPGPDDWSLLTPNEKKRKLDKISKLALALCQEIANTPLDRNVMDYASHKFYFDNFRRHCTDEKMKEKVDFNLSKFCKLESGHYVSAQDNLENVVGNAWGDLGVTAPSVSSLLQSVYSKAENTTYDSVIKRKSQVKRAFFIRRLSSFFQESFGMPLYNITAAISSVFLDEEISIDEVRSTIR